MSSVSLWFADNATIVDEQAPNYWFPIVFVKNFSQK